MDNWSKIEFIFAHKLNINPLILRDLEFYTIQNILKEYQDHIDKENKEYEKQRKDSEKQQKTSSSYKMPEFKMPEFKMPKM